MKSLVVALSALALVMGTTFAAGAATKNDMNKNMNRGQMSSSQTTQQGKLSKFDKKFLRDSGMDNNFEIQASQVAAQKASDPQVKDFAQKLVTDHTQLSNDLSSMASSQGMTLSSTSLEKKDRKELDHLNKLSGKDFDQRYMKDMVRDHKEDIKSFKAESQKGTDPQLQNWASDHISALQGHLQMAENMEKNVK